MARFPPFRWLVPRAALFLVLLAFIQLVAFMGIIPSTQQDCSCKCRSLHVKSKDVGSDGFFETQIDAGKQQFEDTIRQGNDASTSSPGAQKLPSTDGPASKPKQGTIDNTATNCPTLPPTSKSQLELIQTQLKEYKRLAKDLKQLAVDLIDTQKDVVTVAAVYHRLGKHVASINSILHSIKHSPVINNNTPRRPSRNNAIQLKNVVCPEKYIGKDLSVGYPWFRKGFTAVNCTNFIPMPKLITILLHIHKDLPIPAEDLLTILTNIAKMYPGVKVTIASGTDRSSLKNKAISKNLNISLTLRVFQKPNQGEIWTNLLNDVTTPFVFVATDITHFNDDIDFVRLIRMLSNNEEIIIAGGGYRDQYGHWDIGCLQTRLRNWTMSFRGGYYRSFGDCLECDYLEGPWVAKTEDLKRIGVDKKLEYGMFHDLFWNMKKTFPGGTAVSCPDVMFNIHTSPTPDSSLVQLANKWEIKKWIEASGKVRWYGCRRGYEHTIGTSVCTMTKGIANPPCDLENFADAIKFVMKECEDAGLFCELQEGTLLGAVKFNKVLPWERDADITFLTANYSAFKALKPKFAEHGYSLSDDDGSLWCCVDGRQAGGKFKVGTSRFTIEMYGQHMMESEMLAASGQSPTKVQFSGQWVNVVRNPGLFARNRYGPNHLRHAEHWMDLGQDTGWAFYHPGPFTTCPYPGHSACLDQYPADGNIQFSDYTSL